MADMGRFASQKRVELAGSSKKPVTGAAPTAGSAGSAQMTVSVVVRRKNAIDKETLGTPEGRMSREEYAERHGPDPESLRLGEEFAAEFGLTAEMAPGMGRRTVHLTGSEEAMQRAFAVTLSHHEMKGKEYRVRKGEICLPAELIGHVEAVLGLDNRPQAKPHYRLKRVAPQDNAAAPSPGFSPAKVGQLYGFPAGATAEGQTIGIIELGGGYVESDLTAYFKSLGLPAPTVTAVSVDGGTNSPSTADSADGEVMLDIEVCAAVAPGAKIAVYFTPNTDQGFTDAIAQAVHDTTNSPSVVSISWGAAESEWTQQAMTAMDEACQTAAALGVTITVAAGDNGSSDGETDGANHVDFPASSPHVLGCGGTKLVAAGNSIASEVVWNETAAGEGATGGGVSNIFALPTWQSKANVPAATTATGGRGVPDVAGDADPETGYTVRVDGQTMVIGGTSAVAPLWAGLIALANQQNRGSAGFINPALYSSTGVNAFRDITQGDNGSFEAGPGWDACTGLGSPVGAGVVAVVAPVTASAAGD